MADSQNTPPAPTPSPPPAPARGPSPLKVGLILAPIAAIIVAGVWIGVNLGRSPAGAPAGEKVPLETLDAVVNAAQKYMKEGSPGKAEVILAAATKKFPNEQKLLAMHAECLLSLRRPADALAEFERACFVGPDSATYRDFAGVIAAQLGDDAKAEADWGIAQKLDPKNPKYPLYRAQVQRRLGQNDAARANLILATRLDPTISEAWATLAAIALDENRPEMVQQYIDKARKLDPDNTYYRVIQAKGLCRVGRAQDAASLLYAIPEDTRLKDKAVLAELGECLGMMKQPGKAADLYVAASDANADDAELAYQAALWLDRAGQPEKARAMATRAHSLGSDKAATLLSELEDH